MKRLLMSAVLGLSALGASAQSEIDTDSAVRIHGRQIELPAKPYRMWQTDFDIFKGEYDLSNGETMALISRGPRMYAIIGARPRTEVIAASHNEFIAVDRQFKMTLAGQRGDVTGEVWLKVPGSAAQANGDGGDVVRLLTFR